MRAVATQSQTEKEKVKPRGKERLLALLPFDKRPTRSAWPSPWIWLGELERNIREGGGAKGEREKRGGLRMHARDRRLSHIPLCLFILLCIYVDGASFTHDFLHLALICTLAQSGCVSLLKINHAIGMFQQSTFVDESMNTWWTLLRVIDHLRAHVHTV